MPGSWATSGTGLAKPTRLTAWALNSGVYRFLVTDFIVAYSFISVVQDFSSPHQLCLAGERLASAHQESADIHCQREAAARLDELA